VLTIRRRSRDVGVLRSLGFTPRQVGATLLTMAGTTVVIGLAVGVPLGLALGRLAWNETAAALGWPAAYGCRPPRWWRWCPSRR
jgi:ABC-type antimicrobial peptide transport system permease subunit